METILTTLPNHDACLERLGAAFQRRYEGDRPAVISWAPGRVNLMGDHTDYNDGFVLPMTIDRAVYVALRRRRDRRIHLQALNFNETLALDAPDDRLPEGGRWMLYVAGVIQEMHERYGLSSGFEGVLLGNVPLGAGLSSSAALEVVTALGLEALFGLSVDPVEMIQLCQHVEHHYVGVQCGIMDQFTARLGRSGHALFLDCRSLSYESVPLRLGDISIVITNSNARRELASSKYNERRAECAEAVRRLQERGLGIQSLRDLTIEALEKHASALPTPLAERCRHVVTENERTRQSRQLLAGGRLEAFGARMFASHESLRDHYAVSAAELDTLVELARETDGVLGARMTGGGFGGCTVSLVEQNVVPSLMKHTRAGFSAQHGHEPDFYVLTDNLEAGTRSIEPGRR